jgi:hypothetical protein
MRLFQQWSNVNKLKRITQIKYLQINYARTLSYHYYLNLPQLQSANDRIKSSVCLQ